MFEGTPDGGFPDPLKDTALSNLDAAAALLIISLRLAARELIAEVIDSIDSKPTLAAAAADKLADTFEPVPIVELEYPDAS